MTCFSKFFKLNKVYKPTSPIFFIFANENASAFTGRRVFCYIFK